MMNGTKQPARLGDDSTRWVQFCERVELYADGPGDEEPTRREMTRIRQLAGAASGYLYRGEAPAARPATDYTPRLIPHYDGVAIPLEAARILWHR
jgi:glycogen phosphorylase